MLALQSVNCVCGYVRFAELALIVTALIHKHLHHNRNNLRPLSQSMGMMMMVMKGRQHQWVLMMLMWILAKAK